MLRLKRGVLSASTVTLVVVLLTACHQPYSQVPIVTNTPINPDSLFATPISNPTRLSDDQLHATQTAQAGNPVIFTPTPGSGGQAVTPTSTPLVQLPNNPTLTATLAVPSAPSLTPAATIVPGSRQGTWALRAEEFPFCIARRYGVDPNALLQASRLSSPDIYYAGLELVIPSGPAWSVQDLGPRWLSQHPATYVVTGNADTTVYGVACKYGDVTPDAIVAANPGVTLGSSLNVGKSLNIP